MTLWSQEHKIESSKFGGNYQFAPMLVQKCHLSMLVEKGEFTRTGANSLPMEKFNNIEKFFIYINIKHGDSFSLSGQKRSSVGPIILLHLYCMNRMLWETWCTIYLKHFLISNVAGVLVHPNWIATVTPIPEILQGTTPCLSNFWQPEVKLLSVQARVLSPISPDEICHECISESW